MNNKLRNNAQLFYLHAIRLNLIRLILTNFKSICKLYNWIEFHILIWKLNGFCGFFHFSSICIRSISTICICMLFWYTICIMFLLERNSTSNKCYLNLKCREPPGELYWPSVIRALALCMEMWAFLLSMSSRAHLQALLNSQRMMPRFSGCYR